MRRRLFILNDPIAPRLSPALAQEIGLNESILLLQLEFWIGIRPHHRDGKYWTYQSIDGIHEVFPFMSKATINRAIKSLQEQKLVWIETKYNFRKSDRTRWFALRFKYIAKLNSVLVPGLRASNQNDLTPTQNDTTLPESSKNTLESNRQAYVRVGNEYVGHSDDFFADLEDRPELIIGTKTLFDFHPKTNSRVLGKAEIPTSVFTEMYRICFLADSVGDEGLLSSRQRGRAASVLGHLRDNGANLNRLRDFEEWWKGTWMARNGNGGYMPPRPEQIEENWMVAMKSTDNKYQTVADKMPVAPGEQEVSEDLQTIMSMDRRNNSGT